MTLSDLNLPAPWTYQPDSGVRFTEAGRPELDVVVSAEVWRHPDHQVGIFHAHPQSRVTDLADLYGIEVSGVASLGRMVSAELEPHLEHARRRGWL
jgi:hypothetical protein